MNAATPRRVEDKRLRRARRRYRVRKNATAYLFLLPNLAFFTVFLLVPVGWVIRQSFMKGGVLTSAKWVGVSNWVNALSDSRLTNSLRNTVVYAAMVVPTALVLAMALALLLRAIRRGGPFVRTAVYLPSLTPFVLAALLWSFMVHPEFGLLNIVNKSLGKGPINWLGDDRLALPSIAMLEIWHAIGFWAFFFLAALLSVPTDLYQAAEIDGASGRRRFWHITIPWVRPTIVVAALLSSLAAMQAFDPMFVLTDGGPGHASETAVLYIYKSIFESAQPGYGAALSLILLGVILGITLLLLRILRPRAA